MGDTVLAHIVTDSEAATQAIGRALADFVVPGDVIALTGDLGAGKTQLTKGLAAGLGVPEPVTSPTFNILLVHEGRLPLYHFDLYRLVDAAQLEDIDYWGTLEAGGVSVVEWGDRFPEALPEECLILRLHTTGDGEREIEPEARGMRLAAMWREATASLAGTPGVRVTGARDVAGVQAAADDSGSEGAR
jgi:tRNA threonylcarbamoyladenosine biosynthesis protein TsaE